MYRVILENAKGEQLELTNNPAYTIRDIDGLYPPSATINTVVVATMDGVKFNGSRANMRNIVINLVVESPAEKNRINLYKYVKTKHYIKFYFINDSRSVYIEGYVETMPIQFFNMKQGVQISIICPSPYFKNIEENVLEFAFAKNNFEFPFSIPDEGIEFSILSLYSEKSIVNKGDVPNGVIIELSASGLVLNPKIYNIDTNEYFILNFEMQQGDKITIDTIKGEKKVVLFRDGIESNLIMHLEIGSTWFQLSPGDNVFTYTSDEFDENLSCVFKQIDLFEGV